MLKISVFLLFAVFTSCAAQPEFQKEIIDNALKNGKQANESYVRSLKFVKGWLVHADSVSGLIPSNLNDKKDVWEPHNSAADNYPFMVLASYLLDSALYAGKMLDMLKAEQELTSRIGSLPDIYSFSKKGFFSDRQDMGQIIFGASEYIKDGLIPLTEYIGESPWHGRLTEMLDDLSEHFVLLKHNDKYNFPPKRVEEVNGEMLQTLSRMYWMTGNSKYLEWAEKIGDYYMLGECDLSQTDYLRIRDHGCEIIGGLSELYVTLNYVDISKKRQYEKPYHDLLDRILEAGRNGDGLFYNTINPKTGEVIDNKIVDNWGYVFDAYYSVWMVDKTEKYRNAVLKGYSQLNAKYRDYRWQDSSHDGYADALESGICLYNYEPCPGLGKWVDSEMKVMFAMQQDDGTIGGWHGDGNFARTAIMYALWKSQGAHVHPWREDVMLGAEKNDNGYYFVLTAQNDWEGKLVFDTQRHKNILHLPVNYPRINQFPEWFALEKGKKYSIISSEKELTGNYSSESLSKGIPVKLKAGGELIIVIQNK